MFHSISQYCDLIQIKCIVDFGHRVALFSPIWLKESDPAGMMRGLLESQDKVFLITNVEKQHKKTIKPLLWKTDYKKMGNLEKCSNIHNPHFSVLFMEAFVTDR